MRLQIPSGWAVLSEWGHGPFITHADLQRPDGLILHCLSLGSLPAYFDTVSASATPGAIMFNVSTFAATSGDLSLQRERRLIWAPDVGGSICFLLGAVLLPVESARETAVPA